MADFVAAALDHHTANHLVGAIRAWKSRLRESMLPCPPGLHQIEQVAISVMRGHPVNTAAAVPNIGNTRTRTLLLTYSEAADALAVSESTVKRMAADNEIPVVRFGGNTRIHRDDLETFVTRHRSNDG